MIKIYEMDILPKYNKIQVHRFIPTNLDLTLLSITGIKTFFMLVCKTDWKYSVKLAY